MKLRYKNPYITNIHRKHLDFIRWRLGHYKDEKFWEECPKDFVYPIQLPDYQEKEPSVIWINHCTFLLEIDGIRILTDPIWSNRCSPVRFVGPKRRHLPAIPIESLPDIDVVMVSHNHYDHLDAQTVYQLNKKFPDILWIVPQGLKKWFSRRYIHNVKELSWWESCAFSGKNKVGEILATAVPAQHHSGRSLWDADKTLWAGFVMQLYRKDGSLKTLYFVGDTAYNEHDFKKIGNRFSQIDLCMCPIGTYQPLKFMQTVHSSPYDAVEIHKDVQAALSVGMHWKTFRLSEEDMDRPPFDLYLAMTKQGLDLNRFLPVEPGMRINW